MNDGNVEELSVEELSERLMRIENDRAVLEQALEARREQAKHELAQEIRDLIEARGYTLDEILELLHGRRRRGTQRNTTTSRVYPKYVDPDNPKNVYKRGVLPGWMKEKMAANNLDPSNLEHRKIFKEQYLRREME